MKDIADEIKDLKIGDKIASLRKGKGLSVADLAGQCSLQEIALSQIESNVVSPPIAVLLRIARALGKDLGHFLQDAEENIRIEVVRSNERKTMKRKRSSGDHALSYSYQSLAYRKANRHMQPFLVEFDLDVDEELELLTHEGEEFLFLLSGELELQTDQEVISLSEGDSVYFDSSVPHRLIGKGKIKPVALVTIYAP